MDMGPRRIRAFTAIELLVVIAVVVILAAALLPAVLKAKAKAMRIHCVCRLKNVGLAQRIFATDNGELFPWERALADGTNRINFPDLTGYLPGTRWFEFTEA
jgi:prepilin-type N-terminal cleavage/methylation domain-containing protein